MHPPILRTDPECRCAAMLTYGSKLVILPFKRDVQQYSQDNIDGTDINLLEVELGTNMVNTK